MHAHIHTFLMFLRLQWAYHKTSTETFTGRCVNKEHVLMLIEHVLIRKSPVAITCMYTSCFIHKE